MGGILSSKQARIVIDIILVIGSVLSLTHPEIVRTIGVSWKSTHCIVLAMWIFVTLIHIWQHWRFIKALTKKRVILKNKITWLTTICFIPMAISVLLFLTGFDAAYLKFHGGIGRIYILLIIIHTIQKMKQLISLFKSAKKA